jgi:hypothetical protein
MGGLVLAGSLSGCSKTEQAESVVTVKEPIVFNVGEHLILEKLEGIDDTSKYQRIESREGYKPINLTASYRQFGYDAYHILWENDTMVECEDSIDTFCRPIK